MEVPVERPFGPDFSMRQNRAQWPESGEPRSWYQGRFDRGLF
jgi:hypothetical protein